MRLLSVNNRKRKQAERAFNHRSANVLLLLLALACIFLFSGCMQAKHYGTDVVKPDSGQAKKVTRIAFYTDIQFTGPPARGHRYGYVDGAPADRDYGYQIALDAKQALDYINPDVIFDAGDVTTDSEDAEFEYYNNWTKDLPAPVYAVIGNHDRQHNWDKPYGRGFFDICGYGSATRTLKLGNLVFILISQEHIQYGYGADEEGIDPIPLQKREWIRSQLKRYCCGQNNVFLIQHEPLNNTTAWSDTWWRMDWPAWKQTSDEIKGMLSEYQDHIVAVISGHLHTHYSWRDVPNDKKLYQYGDGEHEVEDIGMFVNGSEINQTTRKYPPYKLPEVYFLNLQALDWPHGPRPVYGAEEKEAFKKWREGTVYFADMKQGSTSFVLNTVETRSKKIVDKHEIKLAYPIDLGDQKVTFMESDLSIREKDLSIKIHEDDWFRIEEGQSGRAVFQKQWAKPVTVEAIKVEAPGGVYENVKYKASRDSGHTWSDWSDKPPRDVSALQVSIDFSAYADEIMKVHDVKVVTK